MRANAELFSTWLSRVSPRREVDSRSSSSSRKPAMARPAIKWPLVVQCESANHTLGWTSPRFGQRSRCARFRKGESRFVAGAVSGGFANTGFIPTASQYGQGRVAWKTPVLKREPAQHEGRTLGRLDVALMNARGAQAGSGRPKWHKPKTMAKWSVRHLPTGAAVALFGASRLSPSSRGLGRGPFKAETRVRIPVGTPSYVGPFRRHGLHPIPE